MHFSRRNLLGGAALAGAGLAATSLLTGCGGGTGPGAGGTPGATGGAGGPVTLPNYFPYTGIKPDAPATDTGAAPYFREFPAEPVQFSTEKPLSGGTVSLLSFTNNIPTPLEDNSWWQAINESLGGSITMGGAPVGEYPSKLQVIVAGNDLPDMVVIMPGTVPALAGLLKAKFADLSPHLSGDAVKDYPALANIPTVAWRGCVANNGIYTLPIQRFSLNRCWITRVDLAEKYGVDPQPRSGDDLLAMLRAFTHPKEKVFATAHVWGLIDLFHEMHGTPNQWAVKDGTFTKDYETDAYRAVLEVAAQVWKERLVHPEGFDPNITLKTQDMYNNGMTPFFPGQASWSGNAAAPMLADPAATSVALEVNTWDGSKPAGRWLNSGAPYLTAIKQAEPERIKEVLRVANWLASPWGTKEYQLFQNGVEGSDHTVGADGTLTRTDRGTANRPFGLYYAGAPAMVHFSGTFPELAKAEYDSEVLGMQTAVPLPTVGLESETDQSKGAALTRDMKDLAADIIQGRKPLGDWDAGVKSWRTKGGDAIRAEYEKAHAAR